MRASLIRDPQPHVGRQPRGRVVAGGRGELATGDRLGAPSGEQLLDLGLGRRDPKLRVDRGPWPVQLVQRALDHAAGEVVQLDLVPQLQELEEHRQRRRPRCPMFAQVAHQGQRQPAPPRLHRTRSDLDEVVILSLMTKGQCGS